MFTFSLLYPVVINSACYKKKIYSKYLMFLCHPFCSGLQLTPVRMIDQHYPLVGVLYLGLTRRGTETHTYHILVRIRYTNRVPVEGKSSLCVICMKYRKMILIIIIISLGQILLSYIANTSRTHARMHTNTRAHTHAHPPATTQYTVYHTNSHLNIIEHTFLQDNSKVFNIRHL